MWKIYERIEVALKEKEEDWTKSTKHAPIGHFYKNEIMVPRKIRSATDMIVLQKTSNLKRHNANRNRLNDLWKQIGKNKNKNKWKITWQKKMRNKRKIHKY